MDTNDLFYLKADHKVYIRLHSVEMPDATDRDAVVTFLLFSAKEGSPPSDVGTKIKLEAPCLRKTDGTADLNDVVSRAAEKLKGNFERVVEILSNISESTSGH